MKKILMAAICLMMAMSVNAQKVLNESTTPFEESKFYVGASFSGLSLSYSKASDWSFGLSAKAGYLFRDNWMALGSELFEWYCYLDEHRCWCPLLFRTQWCVSGTYSQVCSCYWCR